eukprot:CAMPEP_0184660618 /NCGR_PEP_ID=MMETSP0308-20130426/34441_1 /TAXON_ID=38269 /ORGANISM="Gloeochaete witrockiana, Strain SAG 46.84" /LENGTH=530 /DNA_ID=CAMNT_0027101309 /DNA_START=290 /DNA_END=1882 /DNA_ORIENTATION=+
MPGDLRSVINGDLSTRRKNSLSRSPMEQAQAIINDIKTRPGLSDADREGLDQAVKLLVSRDVFIPKLERTTSHMNLNASLASSGTRFGSSNSLLSDEMQALHQDHSYGSRTNDEMENWLKSEFAVPDRPGRDALPLPPQHESVSIRNREEFLDLKKTKLREKGLGLQLTFSLVLSNSSQQRLREMLSKVGEWDFDVFELDKLTDGRPLFTMVYTLMLKHDFLHKFQIKDVVMRKWLKSIENAYNKNPYHNAIHAADVVQTFYHFVTTSPMFAELSDLDLFAGIVACAVHDLGHPGLTNGFHIKTEAALAMTYNDRSVLENHHCAQAFSITNQEGLNIFQSLSDENRRDVRALMISMVLSTDMAQHFQIFGDFKTKMEELNVCRKEDKTLMLSMALKVADVSNPAKPPHLARRWADLVLSEFYVQGDKERTLGIPISSFSDRTRPSVAECQNCFMEYIVYPLFERWAQFTDLDHIMDYVRSNQEYWQSMCRPVEPAVPLSEESSSLEESGESGDSADVSTADVSSDVSGSD